MSNEQLKMVVELAWNIHLILEVVCWYLLKSVYHVHNDNNDTSISIINIVPVNRVLRHLSLNMLLNKRETQTF